MRWSIRQEMPSLASSAGVWDGEYIHVDRDAKVIDRHRSRLLVRVFDEGELPYHQTNIYMWDDGRQDRFDFRGQYVNGSREIAFDTPRITGFVKELPEDPFNRSRFLYWRRKDLPEVYFYELITVTDDKRQRYRTWQWIHERDGVFQRTLINERKVSDDWAAYDR
jgi:hypothetical protein